MHRFRLAFERACHCQKNVIPNVHYEPREDAPTRTLLKREYHTAEGGNGMEKSKKYWLVRIHVDKP
jgi:hypothetical protein